MEESKTVYCKLEDFYRYLSLCYKKGDMKEAGKFLQKCEEKLLGGGKNRGILVAVYNEQGTFYRLTGRYHRSIEAFGKAKDEIADRLGPSCAEYAIVINNMAGTYRLARQYQEAVGLLHEAIEIYHGLGEEDSYACASVHKNISAYYQETGETRSAIRHLRLALDIIKDTKDYDQETVVIYSNLTVLYHKAGDRTEAMNCLDKALVIFDTYSYMENPHYGAALNNLGGFLCGISEYDRAVEVYKKAAEYTERFFETSIEYGVSFQNMYWAYRNMGKKESAVQALTTAEKTYLKLFGPEHEHTKTIRNELIRIKSGKVS